ncbi:MAG TPA: hypothetical protein ENF78_03455 [Candidatus Bathyarchaeota archaeon]|nr:hypothetical protein [Candidatus Bathyarchaeota archaeon]
MEWGEALRIARLLEREVIYGTYRGSDPSLDEPKLARLVTWNRALGIAEGFASLVLLLLMVGAPVLLASPWELMATTIASTMLYNVLMFISVLMASSTSALSLQASGSIKVLAQLPLGREDIGRVVLAKLLRSLAPVLLVPIIYGAIVAEKLWLPQAFPLVALYGYVDVLLALAASLALSSALSRRMGVTKGLRSKLARAFWSSLYFTAMFSIGLLYQLYLCSGKVLELIKGAIPMLPSTTGFIYPFSATDCISLSAYPLGFFLSLLCCLAYLMSSILILRKAIKGYVNTALEGSSEAELGKGLRKPRFWTRCLPLNIAIKDLKIAVRDPRTSYIMVLPLFSLISFIPALLNASGLEELREVAYLTCMTLLGTGCILSALVPYQLMEHEGGRLWLLFSTDLHRRELALGKSLATAIAYALYAFPVALACSAALGDLRLVAYATSGTMLCLTASLMSAMLLASGASVDTRSFHISLLKSLCLIVLSAVLSIPILGPLAGLGEDVVASLAVSALELCLVLALNWAMLGR